MSKTVRVRTTPNGNDSYLKVKVEQDFDFIEILSLKISQEEAYARFCSDYGVVVGRVIVNNGFGVQNAKVSIFVPLTDEDEEDTEIAGLYPFKNIDDKDSEGIRYNLLQVDPNSQEACFTPIGTFPSKREVIDNDTVLEVFDKYYKFTTTTNSAGDFMLFGVPTGNHILNVDVDLSDIGVASQRPYDYISEGESPKRFESPTKFKADKDLDKLIQVKSFKKGVNVQPFWGDKEQCDIGISRVDVDIKKKIVPSAIFMGSMFADSEKNSINKNCRPRKDFGRLCETDTGEGSVEMIRKTMDGKIERFDIDGGRVVNEFGSWAYQIPMNLDSVVTDEFGNLVPSEDPEKGIPTRARVRFRIGKDVTGDEGRLRTTANYLVPHNPDPSSGVGVDYNFDENTSDEHFRDFHWNKIYSVSNFIPRVQTTCVGKCADNRNMTGIKDVDDCSGLKNPFPYNRVDTDFNPLFLILCTIMSIITLIVYLINTTVIGFINVVINIINTVLKVICQTIFGLGKFVCNVIHPISEEKKNECKSKACMTSGDGGWSEDSPDYCECASIIPYVPCITISCSEQIFAPGCNCKDVNNTNATVGSGDNDPDGIGITKLGCWQARVNTTNPKNIQHWSGLLSGSNNCGHVGHDTPGAGLTDCLSIQLAEALNMFEFDFYNDWVNGTLYTYQLKYKKRKRGKVKFCDTDCDSADSDNGCDKSWFVDTCVNCATNRGSIKEVTKKAIDEGFIKRVVKKFPNGLEQETLYYTPYSTKVGKKLFATELVHLGSIFDCDWQGIPKIQSFLLTTTYKRPPYIDEYWIDAGGNNTTTKTACGMTSTGGSGESGLFFDIDCIGLKVSQVNGLARCDNFKRVCEWGMNIDEAQLDSNNVPIGLSDCYLNDNDLDETYGQRLRDIFYQLNINDGATKLNSWPSGANGLPAGIDTGFGTGVGLTTLGTEYEEFRGDDSPSSYATQTVPDAVFGAGYTQPKNSFYFYFGTIPGQSAIDLMNRKFFTTCEVVQKNDFTISGIVDHVETPNACDGEINVTVVGGTAPYTYNWIGPLGYTNTQVSPLSGDIAGLCAGQYTVTVTDDTGGSSTTTFTVSQPTAFNCGVTSTNAITNGSTGTITITAGGGVPPYSYTINASAPVLMVGATQTINKVAGTYNIVVTDSTGASCSPAAVTITEPPSLSIAGLTTWTDTSCGSNNGTLNMALSSSIGGTTPYIISITGPGGFSSTMTNLTGLASGTYNISVTDSGLPTPQVATDTIVIAPSVNTSMTYNNAFFCWLNPDAFSQSIIPSFSVAGNGGFTIVATPLDASDNPTTPIITQSFPAGTILLTMGGGGGIFKDVRYNFKLTDSDGCVATAFADFRPGEGRVPSSPLHANAWQSITTDSGTQTGQVKASASGGWTPHTYQWYVGATPTAYTSATLNLSSAQFGSTWTCKITDSKGCSKFTNGVVIV